MINPIKLIKAYISYKQAVKLADDNYKKYETRQYVMAMQNGKLVVGDKKGLRILQYRTAKDKKIKTISVKSMEDACYYHTPYKGNKEPMTDIQIKARKKVCIAYLANYKKK